jgi:hypothetical protein
MNPRSRHTRALGSFFAVLGLIGSAVVVIVIGWRIWKGYHDSERAAYREHAAYYDSAHRRRTLENATVIIGKLDEWKRLHGTYPPTLQDAVDISMGDLAPNAGCSQWFYFQGDGGRNFVLAFGVGEQPYPKMTYESASAAWVGDS